MRRPGTSIRTTCAACVLLVTAAWLGAAAAAPGAQEPQAPPEGSVRPGATPPPNRRQEVRQGQRTQRAPRELQAAVDSLPPRYRQWVLSVAGLITQAELDFFLDLSQDYRRDAFIEAFWKPRDPDPVTPQNELRDRWQSYLTAAGSDGIPYGDPRFVVFLLNGPPGGFSLPDGRPVGRCFSRSRELEIWFYGQAPATGRRMIIIFYKPGREAGYEIYHLGASLRPVGRSGGLPTRDVSLLCADDLMRYASREISFQGDYERQLELATTPPLPSLEWLATFSGSTTDLPAGAETMRVDYEFSYPARTQSRTALQVLVRVGLAEAPGRRFDGQLFHDFRLRGEVIRNGQLFESFDYRFDGPTPDGASEIPLGFTRYLRPGPVSLFVLVEDVFGNRYAQLKRDIEIPSPDGLPPVAAATSLVAGTGDQPASERTLRLIAPPGSIHTGMVRFSTRVRGEFERVAFFLDDKQVISKRRPPYSVELNLGNAPVPHRVRVVGLVASAEAASDQLWLNQGNQRFRVRFIEPRAGGIYPGALTARLQVDTPDGRSPERIELFLNEEPVGTLAEPPFEHSVSLTDGQLAVVKAVAYLADGSSTEDAVLVNSSEFVEDVRVELVELHAVVVDGRNQPVTGLAEQTFRLREDGIDQRILRFEETADAPVNAALLIDRSSSMERHVDRVAEAAYSFAQQALETDDDRLAVMSFAEVTTVDTGFTSSLAQVERALAGIDALGGTGLYDAVVQTLNYFEDVQGQTAIVLFSDGKDEGSELRLEQTIAGAHQAGVTIYTLGLVSSFEERADRRVLEQLAEETGGRAIFLRDLADLDGAYGEILAEIRSRYLIAYQSTSDKPDRDFREIQLEVDAPGAKVRTRRGYFP
ncbi:MAG: VWA domain-containing protein [Acidobacteriota bacterium]|nr:VWA domain-containing protein [Acidobacteriota bacterium]